MPDTVAGDFLYSSTDECTLLSGLGQQAAAEPEARKNRATAKQVAPCCMHAHQPSLATPFPLFLIMRIKKCKRYPQAKCTVTYGLLTKTYISQDLQASRPIMACYIFVRSRPFTV